MQGNEGAYFYNLLIACWMQIHHAPWAKYMNDGKIRIRSSKNNHGDSAELPITLWRKIPAESIDEYTINFELAQSL